jgi:DMSO/TMAO reductase YedYZ molybdopterin-dependent catalytic subunit
MNRQRNRTVAAGLLLAALSFVALLDRLVLAQTAAPGSAPALKIGGNVSNPLELSLADLKSMPRKTITVTNPHDKKSETYEGVLLQALLLKAGAPQGHDMRGAAMATYLLAEASDGYRVLFSLPELDPDFTDAQVLVADTLDGAPLGPNAGPLRLVVPQDKRPARWIRMLKSLTVAQVGK